MPAVFHWKHTVVAGEIDELAHVGNVNYIHWMQSAAVAHSAAQGWPAEADQSLRAGWVVRSHTIEYLRPAFLDDEVTIETWVANMRRVTSLRRYRFVKYRGDERLVLAEASTDWAFIDYVTGTLRRVPAEITSAFELVPDPTS